MALNYRNLKKWYLMLSGKSVLHVDQGVGNSYSLKEIKGYYNNLTHKVLLQKNFNNSQIPLVENEKTGELYEFPIAIFQYGLGAYDLYLLNNENSLLEKVILCANWAKENQKTDGSWEMYPKEPGKRACSAMAQGEAICLLLRVYNETKNIDYINSAKKALDYMLVSEKNNGPTIYDNDDVIFLEYADTEIVLNGWIFALWGLYDWTKTDFSNDEYKKLYERSIQSLIKYIPMFDLKYWSKYCLNNSICSPFYHKLHISQLRVMYELTGIETFNFYADKWKKYNKNNFFYLVAFIKKAYQKIKEKQYEY